MHDHPVFIIGGGLGGLATAAYLARAGHRVTVLERSSALGGRAQTSDVDGYALNLGPHALYLGGAGKRVVDELGVAVAGAPPRVDRGLALYQGHLHPLPFGPLSLMTTRLFGMRERLAVARLFRALGRGAVDPTSLAGRPVDAWVRGLSLGPGGRALVHALIRLSTYTHAPDRLDGASAVRQLMLAQAGVLYLDRGWQRLVDGLRDAAMAAGAAIRTRARVASVQRHGRGFEVILADGARHPARAVVAATPPDAAAALLAPVSRAIDTWAAGRGPVRAACLDLALARLPRPRATFALGLDEPLYLSVHNVAALAPAGGAVVHAALYLGPDQARDARGHRRRLEALMDRMQPGWRDHLVHARFLPAMTVASSLPEAAQQGTRGRPGPAVPDAPGAYVVGDWVGSEGLLADASLASAREAARAIGMAASSRDAITA